MRFLRGLSIASSLVVLFAVGTIAGMVAAYGRNLPDISRMADYQPASTTRIFARDGTQLAAVYKENRVWVPLARIPPLVREAFIANEDHNFYSHHGVDSGGIMRAAFADLTHQQFQGASTITQQLARRLFLNDQVSVFRARFRRRCSPSRSSATTRRTRSSSATSISSISARGAYGVDAAAHTYFGRGLERIDTGTGGDAGRRRGRALRLLAVCQYRLGAGARTSRARSHGRERLRYRRAGGCGLRCAARADYGAADGLARVSLSRTLRPTRSRS